MDAQEIRRWHSVFKRDDELFEIRILGDRNPWSGYFYDIETAIKELERFDNFNIYYSLNEVKSACASREQFNCFRQVKGSATSKTDIEHRWWLAIDVDCERPSGVSSTDEEKAKAHKKAQDVFRFLRDNGFSTPVVCDSSSGFHLLYPIDMDNDQASEDCIKAFLEILANNFTDESVKIDTVLRDANRILRLSGSYGRKGRSSKERPHRLAKILSVPEEIVRMKIEQILAFNSKYEIKVEQPQRRQYNGNVNGEKFNLREFIEKYDIRIAKEIPISGGGTKYILEECPFDSQHKAPDSALFELPNGSVAFKCFHNSCSQYDWRAFRLHFEPHAYDYENLQGQHNQPQQYAHRQYTPQKPKYEIKGEIPELGKKWLTMSSIKKVDLSKIEGVKTGFVELDRSIVKLHYGEVTVLSGSNACVDCDTEYFNGTKWRKISEYVYGEKVLQYNVDGSAEMVIPQRYIKSPCDELYLLQSVTGVDQCVSENHNLVYMTSKGNLNKKTVADMLLQHEKSIKGFAGRFYTTFKYVTNTIFPLSNDEIRIMCAIICDGHFGNKYKDKDIVRINIKKERKKKRLEMLLEKCGIPYRKEQYSPRDLQYSTYLFHAPRHEKEFGDEWCSCSSEQLAIVADENLYWDGTINNTKHKSSSYSSVSKRNIDFVQFAFASIGVRTSISVDDRVGKLHSDGKYRYKSVCYKLTICRTKNPSLINPVNKKRFEKVKTKDGNKYCFTVPSGMLVLRRNGNINITGNSGKSSWLNTLILNIANQGVPTALWSGELPEPILKAWIQMVAAGKNNLSLSQFGDGKYYVPNNIGERIDKWMDDKLFIYNTEYGNQWEQLLADMEVMFNAGIKAFVLDNLMAMNVDLLSGDKNEKQKQVILKIKEFAKKKNVHIILVAHPRKSMAFLRKTDISGTCDLSNAVDNIFIIHRVNNDFIRTGEEFFGKGQMTRYEGFGNVIEVCKNRMFGIVDLFVGMHYETESRRFKNTIDENIKYGWEIPHVQQQISYTYDGDSCANYEGDEQQYDEYDPLGLPPTNEENF